MALTDADVLRLAIDEEATIGDRTRAVLVAEVLRLRTERDRLYKFATTDTAMTRAEAAGFEPSKTAEACRAIDVWNRAAKREALARENRVLRRRVIELEGEIEPAQSWGSQ